MQVGVGGGSSMELYNLYKRHSMHGIAMHSKSTYNILLQIGVGGGSSMDAAKLAAFMCGDTKQVNN